MCECEVQKGSILRHYDAYLLQVRELNFDERHKYERRRYERRKYERRKYERRKNEQSIHWEKHHLLLTSGASASGAKTNSRFFGRNVILTSGASTSGASTSGAKTSSRFFERNAICF